MGKYYQPNYQVEDINSSPRTYISKDVRLEVTKGCPCDNCKQKPTCKIECRLFNSWVHYGPIKK